MVKINKKLPAIQKSSRSKVLLLKKLLSLLCIYSVAIYLVSNKVHKKNESNKKWLKFHDLQIILNRIFCKIKFQKNGALSPPLCGSILVELVQIKNYLIKACMLKIIKIASRVSKKNFFFHLFSSLPHCATERSKLL